MCERERAERENNKDYQYNLIVNVLDYQLGDPNSSFPLVTETTWGSLCQSPSQPPTGKSKKSIYQHTLDECSRF